MRLRYFVIVLCLLATPALAQQQPDPAFLQKAVASLQQQRNAALDQAAVAQATLAQAQDEIAKLKAELEQLKQPPK